VLDCGRDRLRQLDELTRWRFTGAISTADRWLPSAAGAVERVPLLRRGDRAETSR
jgi:hypothetical protein